MIKLLLGAAYPTSPFVLRFGSHNKCCNSLHDTVTFDYTLFLLKLKTLTHKMVNFPLGLFVNLFTE